MVITIAFVALTVLAVLFGVCMYVFFKNNRESDSGEKLYDDAPAVERPPFGEEETVIGPAEEETEEEAAPPITPNAVTDAELLSMDSGAETPDEAEYVGGKKINLVPIIAAAAAALAVLCAVAVVMVKHEADKRGIGTVKEPQTITATVSNISKREKFNAAVECENLETSIFAASGKVEEVKVKEGDSVKRGDVIYSLDSSNIEERIEVLKERLKTFTKTEEKTVEEETEVKAFSDGTITKIYVSAGDIVTEKAPIAEVTEIIDYKAAFAFDAEAAADFSRGDEAAVISGGASHSGSITAIARDDENGVVNVTVVFKASGQVGSTASASVNGIHSLGSGAVSPNNKSDAVVLANISGELKRVGVRAGDKVENGETIAVISTEKKVSETKTDELAEKDVKLQIEQLEDELQNYTVKAPCDGRVKKLYMKKGDNAAVNMQAVTIIPENSLFLSVSIASDKAEKISVPASAEFKIIKTGGFSSDIWKNIDTDRTYSAIMDTLLPDGKNFYKGHIAVDDQTNLLDGMSAEVNVVTYSKYDAILLPEALVKNGKVKIWRANKIEEVEVETGITTDDGYIEIVSGINSVDKIVNE